jgi:hypothetical protein
LRLSNISGKKTIGAPTVVEAAAASGERKDIATR